MLDLPALLDQAREGTLLLAPSLRAARELRLRLLAAAGNTMQGSGAAGRVTHWHAFTAELWQQALVTGAEQRLLLTPIQERYLWQHTLEAAANKVSSQTFVPGSAAMLDLCLSAASLVFRHGVTEALLHTSGGSADTRAFAHWFRSFNALSSREHWLPPDALESALADHVASRSIDIPQHLILCGFAEPTPAQRQLVSALRSSGTSVDQAPNDAQVPARQTRLLDCADADAELHALLDHLQQTAQNGSTVTVIVPDLSASRDRMERALRDRFVDAGEHALDDPGTLLWEFSTGTSLAAQPSITDALRLLHWTVTDLSSAELSALLRSPGLCWPVDEDSRAALDSKRLRRAHTLQGTWSPASVQAYLAKPSPAFAAWLRKRTRTWNGLRLATATYSVWAQEARELLRSFGWPGPHTLTSLEFQIVQRWEEALDSLASLDVMAPQLSWADFLATLADTVRRTIFAPRNTGAPIQFVTPEEATGVEVADIWFLHADESAWNGSTSPHPLLLFALQRAHAMPGTDPVNDVAVFQRAVERVAAMAPAVTFSYASAGESGGRIRPSAQVVASATVHEICTSPSGVLASLHGSAELEVFADDPVPLAGSRGLTPGGQRVLQLQSNCAFQAFAEFRLGSTALETDDLGMDPRERGTLLHAVLSSFWRASKNSFNLQSLIADGRLRQSILHHIEQVMQQKVYDGDNWSAAYLKVQRDRLARLLGQWLEFEAKRPPFTVIGTEQKQSVTLGNLLLNVTVDRIDQVMSGGVPQRVYLDYKTSEHTANEWLGDRPKEPQLPLYATMPPAAQSDQPTAGTVTSAGDEVPVGAIAFAILKPGKDMGLSSQPHLSNLLYTGERTSDASLSGDLDAWQSVLHELADDFSSGINLVNPRDYPTTCRFCAQRLLCRIDTELAALESDTAEQFA